MGLRWLGATVLLALALGGAFVGQAITAGPGGWDHVGTDGTPSGKSINGNVSALNSDAPGLLLVGGDFTSAGGNTIANRIASWNGSAWSPVGSANEQIGNGIVHAIAYANGKIYAGGTFLNAGGEDAADRLAVWDGTDWKPICSGVAAGGPVPGNVKALQVVGQTLYAGGEFQDWGGDQDADYLIACNLGSGTATATLDDTTGFGPVEALTADSNGRLYAGGRFRIANTEAENVAYLDANGWHAMGTGPLACQCAIDGFVRSLAANGTDVYVGTDVKDVAGIAQADNVALWSGTSWSAVGSNAAGTDGYFSTLTFINALTTIDSKVFAAGSFQNASGDAAADIIAVYDAGVWRPVGSNGAGDGPLNGSVSALAIFDRLAPATTPRTLFAGGAFTAAGGDPQASRIASFALGQITPVATPTVTPSATPVPTPVATPMPQPTPTVTPTPPTPRISALRLSRTTFRAALSGAPFRAARAAVGTIVSFTLTDPGRTRFTVDRSVTGRSVKGRCVKTSSSNRSRPSCRRWTAVKGSFTVPGRKGANKIEFRGRIGGRRLGPGRYRLNAVAISPAGLRSFPKRTAFKIVR